MSQASFSEKRFFKRKYHDGLKLVCVNNILRKLAEDGEIYCSTKKEASDLFQNVPISMFFSKYLTKMMNILVLPRDVEHLWPIVQYVTKYLSFYDDGIFEYSDENQKELSIRKAGKYKTILKAFGYNVDWIPKSIVK